MDISQSICEKLDITTDQLNSLYTAASVNGFIGTQVAAEIVQRFGLNDDEPLGSQLADSGVLTEEEGEYLDDAE